MSKSKQTKVFVTDGRRARFNNGEFKYCINEARKQLKPDRPGKRVTLDSIFQRLAFALWGECSEEVLESRVRTIEHWYYGHNGPSELDIIYRMAECLECEQKDQFLKYEKMEEKQMEKTIDNIQNTNTIAIPTVKMMAEANYRAMKRMRAQEEAYKLHAMFLDLIAAYNEADMDTWLGNEPMSAKWKIAAKRYPDRCPVELAVYKARCYLSSELRHSLFAFLENMFGPAPSDWYEVNSVNPDATLPLKDFEASEFVVNKLRRFSAYLQEHDIEEDKLDSGEKERWMFNFLEDEANNWYLELERVFEDYVID